MKKILIAAIILGLHCSVVYCNAKDYNDDINQYFQSAMEKYQNKDYEGAIADYEKIILIHKNEPEVYHNMAVVKYASGNIQGALKDIDTAISIKKEAAFYDTKGIIYLINNDTNSAIQNFSEAIKINPTLSLAYTHRATCYIAQWHFESAVEDLTNAINYYANQPTNNLRYLTLNLQKGDIQNSLLEHQNLDIIYSLRAYANWYNKNVSAADEDSKKALSINPNNSKALFVKGLVQIHNKQYESSIQTYSKLIQLPSDNNTVSDAYLQRARAYAYLNNFDKAMQDLNKSIGYGSNNGAAYYLRGTLKQHVFKDSTGGQKDIEQGLRLIQNKNQLLK